METLGKLDYMCSAIGQFFPPVSPRSPVEENEMASVRKGSERGFWA